MLRHCPYQAIHDLSILEYDDCRDGLDAVARGDLRMYIHIELCDCRTLANVLDEFFQDMAHHSAGVTPFGPEIYQDWLLALKDIVVKRIGCELYWLPDRRSHIHGSLTFH